MARPWLWCVYSNCKWACLNEKSGSLSALWDILNSRESSRIRARADRPPLLDARLTNYSRPLVSLPHNYHTIYDPYMARLNSWSNFKLATPVKYYLQRLSNAYVNTDVTL